MIKNKVGAAILYKNITSTNANCFYGYLYLLMNFRGIKKKFA